jgi:hypothetical protein
MAVITSPTYNPASAYRPIVWQVMYTTFPPDVITNCKFTITTNGGTELIAVGRVAPYLETVSLTPPAVEYYFYVDVQQYIQRYLTKRSRRSTFGNLNADTRVENTDSFLEFEVTFEYEYRNASNGKIETFPLSDSSGFQYACITTRQNGEDMSLDEFLGTPLVTLPKRFLTNSPEARTIKQDENIFLSFLSQWNQIQIQTFDSTGTVINTAYLSTLGGLPNEMNTIGVGKPQLQAIPSATFFLGIAPNFTGATSYTIVAGLGVNLFTAMLFFFNSETHTYTFGDACGKQIRLYWTNALGGVDNYDFSYTELGIAVTGELFQKPLNWPHTQDDYGRAKTNIQANKAYQCSKLMTNSEMAWIKELFYSVEVYMVNPNDSSEYWRVWIADTEITEKRKVGLFEVDFVVNLSQDIITHRI